MDTLDQMHGASSSVSPDAEACERREHGRRSVLWPARLRILGKPDVRCFVLDLADSGARLRTQEPVALGTLVKLRSLRFLRQGYVVWCEGDLVGLRFTETATKVVEALDSSP